MQASFTANQEVVQLSALRPVRVQRLNVQNPVGPHDHAFTELCVVHEGTGRHLSEEGECQLVSGSVVVIPPGPIHAFDHLESLRVTNVYYLTEWFLWDLHLLRQHEGLLPLFFAAHLFPKAEWRRLFIFSLDEVELEACRRELNDIEVESGKANPSTFFIRGAFSKLLVILAGAAVRAGDLAADFGFRPEVWRALERMDAALREGSRFGVAPFARGCGLSADGFTRVFRMATGLNPTEYFQRRRVQHAGHLLLRSDLAVGEIAGRLGYADAAHLTRQFSRWQGCSPREFRRLYEGKLDVKHS